MRNTTRSPHGDRSLQRFLRGLAMSSLAGGLALMLAGPLSAQPTAAQPAAQPQPDATKQPVAKPPASRPTADEKLRAQMAIKTPLMTLKEDEALGRRIRLKISKILRDGVLNAGTRAAIDEWTEWRLYRMTITEIPKPKKPKRRPRPKKKPPQDEFDPGGPMPGMQPGEAEEPEDVPLDPPLYLRQLAQFNRIFLKEIGSAAKFQANPPKAEAFRRYVLDGVIKKSRDLFDNNFYVRLNVVFLLSQLNLDEGNFRGVGKVAYVPVVAPLLEIIRDTEQHEALKIPAVLGLKRILLIGRAKRDVKNEIALELLAQLKQDASMYWYPMRLVETLGRVDEPLIQRTLPGGNKVIVQQPFHVQALTVVMRDPSQHWLVRSEAAKSLGRISLHASVNTTLLSHEIVVLSSQMSAAYNKNPNQFHWHQSFFNVYLAFKPLNSEEKRQILNVKPATLISKFDGQKPIRTAYAQILPAVIHILHQPQVVNNIRVNQPIPAATIQATTAWIGKNKPSINRVAPGLPVLEDPKPTAAKTEVPVIQPAAIVRDN